ncbi:MAG: DNA gyrase inhibitor YacG [Bryobacteraceae bacterium]
MRCPICRKEVDNSNTFAPFCSERCKLIDLGKWASGQYVIPGAPDSSEEPDEEERP